MKTKRLSVLLSLAIAVIGLSACASKTTTSSSATSSSEKTSESVDLNSLDLPQLDPNVKDDEDLVQVNTTEGAIKIKLFPKIAPKAVENFVTHAKEGYYNGVTFHRIIEDFMIQSGDPKGDGTGGESIWGKGFAAEISNQLYHLNGALSMASSSAPNSLGSQFFIVQNHEDKSDGLAIQYYPQKIIDAYKNGGRPELDGKYAVFGQVIEGMDVVDKIAKQEVTTSDTGEQSKPVNPVKITSIDVLQEAK
ncbi:peptidylprolyl isomerase [uncultured Enterococcus sp.]|uniref:peptidylprolyl isomerase n=1 Tax=uncultured Enterococcus sp. TaxID=167972 RepID=UPI0025F5CE75|nr:peptidylprolyl isomerase [uncultured Enterococcus sp.]